jgi:glycosyltransferase involved in cell wall biosynthesis
MISKALVIGAYQRKLEEIAAHPDIALTVIVPEAWKDVRGMLHAERAYTKGYTLLADPIRFNGNFHLHFYPRLARRIREVRPHIVHMDEEPYNLATFQAFSVSRKSGAQPLFFTWQNIARSYPLPFSWMEKRVLFQARYAIAGTDESAKVWREKGYTGPLAVIPQFGVDPDLFKPEEAPRPRSEFHIGYAGRLVEEKGLDLLIRAVARVPGSPRLSFAGDGPARDDLRRLAGVHNIGGSVAIVEPLPSTQMPEFYHSLDALVLPSLTRPTWKEQFGRVLIEAMACGVPVIGSDSGAIPEVIGNAGIIVPEGEVEALAAALTSLVEHPRLAKQLAEAGRARVLDRFTQQMIADQTVRVYRDMIAG